VLMEVLEAAQVGRLSRIDLDNEAVVARALPENPAARERMLKHLSSAQRPNVKSLAGLLPQPIQPSTVAMVALKVIEGSSSWRKYLIEPATGNPVDAERLVCALVALFREGDKDEPRASDWVRTTPDKTPWDPDLGPISIIRRQVMNAVGIGPNASGILTGADKVRFLNHFVRLFLDGDENERLFAGKVLATVGPADIETMQRLVDSLFSAAIGEIDEQEPTAGSLSGYAQDMWYAPDVPPKAPIDYPDIARHQLDVGIKAERDIPDLDITTEAVGQFFCQHFFGLLRREENPDRDNDNDAHRDHDQDRAGENYCRPLLFAGMVHMEWTRSLPRRLADAWRTGRISMSADSFD